MLKRAARPYLYIGGGVVSAQASPEVRKLAALIDAPVTTTLMALGAFPGKDIRNLGMPGMHGTYEANRAMQECDVLLAVGVPDARAPRLRDDEVRRRDAARDVALALGEHALGGRPFVDAHAPTSIAPAQCEASRRNSLRNA